MSKIGFPIILFLIITKGYSQPGYFVLIQADNDQPFYARLDNKTFVSSPKGHLILPQLKDSTYNFIIGFPKIAVKEEKFSISINKKDRDLQLRNLGEKGWALFNRQTQEWILPSKSSGDSTIVLVDGTRKEDAFSRLMAGVVNDTAVMYNTFTSVADSKDTLPVKMIPMKIDSPVVREGHTTPAKQVPMKVDSTLVREEQKTPGKQIPMKVDSPVVREEKKFQILPQKSDSIQNPKKNKATIKVTPQTRPTVLKIKQRVLNTALQLIYVDKSKPGGADTIILFIPFETQLTSAAATDSSGNSSPEIAKRQDTSLSANHNPIIAEHGQIQPAGEKKSLKALAPPKADCKNFASENDVDRLRVKILGEKKMDDKIAQARKAFKTKCFSSKQIKTLSELFPDDESKYTFFDTAYPFVSDRDNFNQLAQFLIQEYYLNRFKALTGQ